MLAPPKFDPKKIKVHKFGDPRHALAKTWLLSNQGAEFYINLGTLVWAETERFVPMASLKCQNTRLIRPRIVVIVPSGLSS